MGAEAVLVLRLLTRESRYPGNPRGATRRTSENRSRCRQLCWSWAMSRTTI